MNDGLLATVAAAAANPTATTTAAPPAPPTSAAVPSAPAAATVAPPAPVVATAPDQAAIAAAVKADRERCASIDGLSVPGFEALAAKAKADGTSVGDFAVALVTGIKAAGRLDAVAAMRAAAATVPDLAPAPSATGGSGAAPSATAGLSGEAKWKAEFEADPKLRGEYLTVESYVATMKRDARKAA